MYITFKFITYLLSPFYVPVNILSVCGISMNKTKSLLSHNYHSNRSRHTINDNHNKYIM